MSTELIAIAGAIIATPERPAAYRRRRDVARLTPGQQRNLLAPYDGVNSTQVKRAKARRQLRELVH